MELRHLSLKRFSDHARESTGSFHDDVDQEFAPDETHLGTLAFQFLHRLMNSPPHVRTDARSRIEHTVDGSDSNTGLERDFLD